MARLEADVVPEAERSGIPSALRMALVLTFSLALALSLALAAAVANSGEPPALQGATSLRQRRLQPEVENVTGTGTAGSAQLGGSCEYGRAGDQAPAHAGCIVTRGGRLLAIRLTYDGRRYDIPGGQSNWREPARCTAQREALEETGYKVAPGRLLAVVRNKFHIYKCNLVESRPIKQPDHEVSWVGWLSRAEVKSQLRRHGWRFPEAHRYLQWL
mmetsp:Transcript_108314/g.316864  ORF Transcript_108314/g.316864 Transcript_108314/m.316864 type:complete len:215 (-) Transcript_108314:571-1215(-)